MGGALSGAGASRAVPIATAARHSAQNIAFHEVGRQAIMADPELARRRLLRAAARRPETGLAVARMAAHITYLSEAGAAPRSSAAGCRTARPSSYGFDADFQVESYLRHQGDRFVDRFDANSYLYITRAMDYFDLAARARRRAGQCLSQARTVRFCVLSLHLRLALSDRREPRIVHALNAAGRQRQLRRDRDRQAATTPSCSTSRISAALARLPQRRGAAPRPAAGLRRMHERR